MTAQDLLPLRALSFPIVVPTELAGFVLQSVEPFTEEGGFEGYRIEWRAGNTSLSLHGASGGIGDPPPGEETLSFHSPTFGDGVVEVEDGRLLTGWMSEMESGLPAYSLAGIGIEREPFLRIASSLDYIKV